MKITYKLYKSIKDNLIINDVQLKRTVQLLKLIPGAVTVSFNLTNIPGELNIKNTGKDKVELFSLDGRGGHFFDVVFKDNGEAYYYPGEASGTLFYTSDDVPDELRDMLSKCVDN